MATATFRSGECINDSLLYVAGCLSVYKRSRREVDILSSGMWPPKFVTKSQSPPTTPVHLTTILQGTVLFGGKRCLIL